MKQKLFSIFFVLAISIGSLWAQALDMGVSESTLSKEANLVSAKNNAPQVIWDATWTWNEDDSYFSGYSYIGASGSTVVYKYKWDSDLQMYMSFSSSKAGSWVYPYDGKTYVMPEKGTYTLNKDFSAGQKYVSKTNSAWNGSTSSWWQDSNSLRMGFGTGNWTVEEGEDGPYMYTTNMAAVGSDGNSYYNICLKIGRPATYKAVSVNSANISMGTVSYEMKSGYVYTPTTHFKLNSVYTISATPKSGYRFVSWSDGGAQTHDITITGDQTYTATFAPNAATQYTISTAVTPAGYGTVSGGGTYYENDKVTLTATSANEHLYFFDHWLKDNNAYVGGATIIPTVTAAATYTAVFAAREVVNITANGTQTRDDGNWYAEGTDANGYTIHLYFDSNNALNTANSWIGKSGNTITAQDISIATVTMPDTKTLHIEATIIGDDNKKYVVLGDFDKDLTPIWGDFKFGRDEITLESFQYDWWAPYNSRPMIYSIKGKKSGTSNNYVWLCFKISETSTYNGQIGPKSGTTYSVVTPTCTGFYADTYNHRNIWLWEFPNNESNAMIGWGADPNPSMSYSYYDYPCSVSSYFGDYVNDDNVTAQYAFNGMSAIVDKGKDGNIYVQIVNNDGNRYVTIGEPAQPYDLAWEANDGELSGSYTAAGSVDEGATITAPTATRTGYTFTGWSPAFTGTMPSTNVTYTAQWTPTNYSINYNGLEGATNSNPTSYNVETPTITLADPGVRDGYIFAGWKDESDNAITQITQGSTGNRTLTATWTAATTLDLYDDRDATYYNNIKDLDEKTYDVTLNRTFKPERWSTICLPFEYNQAQMEGHPLKGNINEYLYSEGNADLSGSGLILYFKSAKSIEAGKPYLVRNNTGSDIVNPIFGEVTIDTDKDTEDADIDYIRSKFSYKKSGSISLVGTFRKIQLPVKNHAYMGLMYDETAGKTKIYYPGTNANVPAYRAFFYDSNPASASVQQRVRIVVDGVDMGELLIDNGELLDADKADDRAPRKYIRNGVLVIERNGVTYDAQGKRL